MMNVQILTFFRINVKNLYYLWNKIRFRNKNSHILASFECFIVIILLKMLMHIINIVGIKEFYILKLSRQLQIQNVLT